VNANAKVCDAPLPVFGFTDTEEGGPLETWNEAVSVMGPFSVIEVLFAAPVYEPVPVPVHPVKVPPLAGVAEIATVCPARNQLLDGVTVPPAPAFMVRKYSVSKFAVKVIGEISAVT
jgi:hypothetical protein